MKYLLLSIIFATGLLVPVIGARAITVSPVKFDTLEIAPGGSVRETVRMLNDTGERETFGLIVENFIAWGEDGGQEYIREEHPSDLASWIHVENPTVTLNPGEIAEFPFVITVPNDAEPGGHYATMFFAKGAENVSGSGVGISEQVGVLLLVRVQGEIREDVHIESFRVTSGNVISHLPATFELRVRNMGSVHLKPRGTVTVRNILGSTVARIAANPRGSNVLPASVRRMDSGWVRSEDIPEGGFITQLRNEWSNFAVGRYSVEAEIEYGSHAETLVSERVHFWVFPWRSLLLVVAGAIVLAVLIKGYNTLLVRAALSKERKRRK